MEDFRRAIFFTDADGDLILPDVLPLGNYRIEEVSAPFGYVLNENYVEVKVDTDTFYEVDSDTYEAIITVEYENAPAVGELVIEKKGEVLDAYKGGLFADSEDKEFVYKEGSLAGAKFEIYAAEDIYTADIDIGSKDEERDSYREHNDYRDGRFVWGKMIARDLDACILQAGSFEEFMEMLRDKGYEIKQGKHLAVKPPGMGRYRRCRALGDDYTEERIRQRIAEEDLSFYRSNKEFKPEIVKCYIRRYKRARLTGLQKRYYAKLYRIGKLKKRPYSQVWKYKDDIKKMEKLQQQYLFLVRHDVHSVEELASAMMNLTDKRKKASADKSRVYRAKQRCKDHADLY